MRALLNTKFQTMVIWWSTVLCCVTNNWSSL